MSKLKLVITFLFIMALGKTARGQVWYPEGVYTFNEPTLVAADNQLITIAKASVDATYSYWQVAVYDGGNWTRLPLLVLNKTAELTDIKRFGKMIYVSGNFTFFNTGNNALVRFNDTKWEGMGNFRRNGQPAAVNCMDVRAGNLVIGGNFATVGTKNDSIPFLTRYNGLTFNHYFDAFCKDCDPDNPVLDITSNDSVVAFAGLFTRIMNRKTMFLFRITDDKIADTFTNSPKYFEKLALDGKTIYATGGDPRDKHVYKVTNTIADINANLDSALNINEIIMLGSKPVICGQFNLVSSTNRVSILQFENSKWTGISNNYSNAHYIAGGRGSIVAIGNPAQPISVWNPNKYVVRFFPEMALYMTRVFLDSNNNCVMDANERPLPRHFIRTTKLNKAVFTNDKGMAEFLVPNVVGSQQIFTIKPLRNFAASHCADTTVTKNPVPGLFLDTIQFPLKRIAGINDIRVSISSPKGISVARNKKVIYNITYENVGSNPISGKIQLKKNPLFTNEQSVPNSEKKESAMWQWSYQNLQPSETQSIVYYADAADTAFDRSMSFSAMASSLITSGSTSYSQDDVDSIPQEVETPVSPFRKIVYPTPQTGDSITYLDIADRDLKYQILFNNFSTDTVFYAVVIDTLDLNLDMSYIQETGSNKYYYTEVQTDPNNQYKGILIWHFPNIKLVPNPTHNFEILESGSYIGFKVITKPLSNGYMLKNVASVFYDNEYAGTTNSVYCTVAIDGIDELATGDDRIKAYPNPFNGEINLAYDFQAGDAITVYNAQGQEVYSARINAQSASQTIDLGELSTGVYIVQVFSDGQLMQRKLLKL